MVKGSDGETCCRLLLLETTPGSLDEARLAWPAADVFKCALGETQGVADQIAREKIQIVFSDLSGKGCSALNVLSQIRRVHPQLPLVAILPEKGFSLGLSAFRLGAADVLVHPRDGVVRYRTGSLLSVPIQYQQRIVGVLNVNNKRNRETFTGIDQEQLQTIAHQVPLEIESIKLVGHLRGEKAELEQAHESLVKLPQDRTRFVCNLSHELKTPLTSVLGFSALRHAGLSYVICMVIFFLSLTTKKGLQSAFFYQPEWS